MKNTIIAMTFNNIYNYYADSIGVIGIRMCNE